VEVASAVAASSKATDSFCGWRHRVPYDKLLEAAHYARFACAVYGVMSLSQEEEDAKNAAAAEGGGAGNAKASSSSSSCSCGSAVGACCGGCRAGCGLCVPACAPPAPVTHSSIRESVLEIAGIDDADLLYYRWGSEEGAEGEGERERKKEKPDFGPRPHLSLTSPKKQKNTTQPPLFLQPLQRLPLCFALDGASVFEKIERSTRRRRRRRS